MNRPAPVVSACVLGQLVTDALLTMYPFCENALTSVIELEDTAALTLPGVPLVTTIPQPPLDAVHAFSAFTTAMKLLKYGLPMK